MMMHVVPSEVSQSSSSAICFSTLAAGAAFTMPAARTAVGGDRWRTFLSNVSLMATASGFDVIRAASIQAQWWSGRARI